MKNKCARFNASAAKYLRYALFCGTAQRTVVTPTDGSGKPTCPIFYGTAQRTVVIPTDGTAQRTVVTPTDGSGQPTCPIFKFQEIQKNTSRNVGKDLPLYAA